MVQSSNTLIYQSKIKCCVLLICNIIIADLAHLFAFYDFSVLFYAFAIVREGQER
jgi:hypothetical protein